MPRKGLRRAEKLFRARRFPEVIRFLEPQIFRFRENFEFYYILGVSCLYSGDFGGAFSYLSRAEQMRKNDNAVLAALAAIHFKRGETDDALRIWLDTLDSDPGNRIARKGLEIMRRGLNADEIHEFVESGKLRKLFPKLPFAVPTLVPILSAIVIVGALSYIGVTIVLPSLRQQRPGLDGVQLSSRALGLVETDTEADIQLTQAEVTVAFDRAKRYLADYRDNLALVEINRILLSNASAYAKESAALLKTFIQVPDFSTVRDVFSFTQVEEMPALYNGCFVVWEGKLDRVRIGQERIEFDLLVGYHDEKELLGVVPVQIGFAANLQDGTNLKILAEVMAPDAGFSLRGVSIQKLY